MSWLGIDEKLVNHPKLFELANLMDMDIDQTLGKLVRLWIWCLDYAEDGDLRKHSDFRLGSAVGLQDGQKWAESLVKAGWVDLEPYRRIHDWWDHAGLYLRRRYEKNPEKWKSVQLAYESRTATKLNLTKLNSTKEKACTFDFELLWKDYPQKVGKEDARKFFLKTVLTEKDFFDINAALSKYKQHLEDNDWKQPQNGKTWFNNWRDWVEFVEPNKDRKEAETLKKRLNL